MNTKFFECSVAQMYRGYDYKGQIQGGAMYVIEKALPKKYHFLGTFFALCGLVGTLSLFQINQLAAYANTYFSIDKAITGSFFAFITIYILSGGLKKISKVCSFLVPVMSVLYFLFCVIVIVKNSGQVINVLSLILSEALSPSSAWGGISGYSFGHILMTGLKRATFSNEAGIGTAPMAHANSKTTEPISEGYVAMLGPFLDTIVICTLTGVVILLSFPQGIPPKLNGIEISTSAFVANFGEYGKYYLGGIITLFAFSTMIGMANYNQKCWDYLLKGKYIFKDKFFIFLYGGSIILGAVLPLINVINLMDIAYGLMTIPNIFATIFLAKKIKSELVSYNKKLGLNEKSNSGT
jgi:AGCS family alanine or glycine:cation symporter